MQTLLNFITNTLPKPVLVALLYRLLVLQFASQILPTIGADNWEREYDSDDGRPVRHNFLCAFLSLLLTSSQTSKLTLLLLTYRQAIFVTVYSHLLRKSSL